MVFRGGRGSSHSPRDFASLARAGSRNGQLVAVERANRRGQSPLLVVETAPAPITEAPPAISAKR
jgi:hypothetical protein